MSSPYLIISGDFVPTGGMDRANLALAVYLAETNDSVHLVAHRVHDAILKYNNVFTHAVPRPLGSHFLGEPLLNYHGKKVAKRLSSKLNPFVVVNGGNCRPRQAYINWAHYVHAAWHPSGTAKNHQPFLKRIKRNLTHQIHLRHEKEGFQNASLIIANSHLTANHISDFYQVPSERIQVVYYGSDQKIFGPVSSEERASARSLLTLPSNRPCVLFVGALDDSRKGFDHLYDAWKVLCRKSDWDATLLVVGSGSSLPYYRQAALDAGLSDKIRFLGFRSDVPTILAATDMLVSPARYEAYGLNVHEALCRGCPVLVNSMAGVAERIPDVENLSMKLTANITTEELVSSLIHWRENENRYALDAKLLSEQFHQHSWHDQMRSLVEKARSVIQ